MNDSKTYIHLMSRLEFSVCFLESRAVPHEGLLYSGLRQEYKGLHGGLLGGVSPWQSRIGRFFELVSFLILADI